MVAPARAETPPGLDSEKARIAALIDHTNLYPDAREEDIRRLCEEALQYKFACAVVQSCWVPLCAELLKGSGVKVCSIVSFPLGGDGTASKVLQAQRVIEEGAEELDMVANIGYIKSGKWAEAEEDVARVVQASGAVPVKVIIEACLLTDEEKVKACLMAQRARAAFVKSSTGFREGAIPADVALMRRVVGPDMGVKASGGIRTLVQVRQLIEAGANRIGTSASVGIVS
jgi:deoxyribose-phosphate aldolase